MFIYEKKLQFPVKIANPNPKLAAYIISQYGGPDGELGASMRYLSQRYAMPYAEAKGVLTDIGTDDTKSPRIGASAVFCFCDKSNFEFELSHFFSSFSDFFLLFEGS